MRSAYNVHPEVGCFYLSTNLRRKAGLALAFIAVGSIAGASGVIVQMAGHEPNVDGRSVIAAIPINPSAALSTIVSPVSPAASAPDNRQDFASPPNSVQAAPVNAITAAVKAPATTTELPQQPVAASKKSQKTARSQNRRDRGWYDAYSWRQQHADYGRGRGYGRDYARPDW
jgi:hypothetical protein